MESLIGHPRTRRGRNRTETYFHHVRVRIPRNDYVHDQRLNAGADGQALIKDLIEVHIKKLGKYVPEGQAVRYRLEPDPNLAEKQVRFLFGPAIYLPSAQESPIYRGIPVSLGLAQTDQRFSIHFGIADSHLVHQPVFNARWSAAYRPATFSFSAIPKTKGRSILMEWP